MPDLSDRYNRNPCVSWTAKKKMSGSCENAPSLLDHICDECKNILRLFLNDQYYGYTFNVDKGIVRGLDYYTKTVFEFVSKISVPRALFAGWPV